MWTFQLFRRTVSTAESHSFRTEAHAWNLAVSANHSTTAMSLSLPPFSLSLSLSPPLHLSRSQLRSAQFFFTVQFLFYSRMVVPPPPGYTGERATHVKMHVVCTHTHPPQRNAIGRGALRSSWQRRGMGQLQQQLPGCSRRRRNSVRMHATT